MNKKKKKRKIQHWAVGKIGFKFSSSRKQNGKYCTLV